MFSLDRLIGDRFLERLAASPRGRAFMLSFMAQAEEADEQSVFETLVARVDDAKLNAMVRVHMTDEERHASLLRARLAQVPVPPPPVPMELNFVARVDTCLAGSESLGGRFVKGELGVMEAYLLLEVVEERAVREWPHIVKAFHAVGEHETADTIAAIIEDEKRHVRYSRAIAQRYAPDEDTYAKVGAAYRAAEDEAYNAHKLVFTKYCIEQGLLDVGPIEGALWKLLARAPVPATTAPAAAAA